MNKVITINLNGHAYPLEETGYEALRAYMDTAGRMLSENPDRDEIVADIEQAIADKCRATLGAHRSVVASKDIEAIIAEMGPVEDSSARVDKMRAGENFEGAAAAPAKRLYRIYEGASIAGVCNGIAAYFGIDVTLVRVIFLGFAIVSFGGALLVYALMEFMIPAAKTASEMAAAYGRPVTAEEFVRRAGHGYYEEIKAFGIKNRRGIAKALLWFFIGLAASVLFLSVVLWLKHRWTFGLILYGAIAFLLVVAGILISRKRLRK
jgi:phage shock protein PspC (stress-responsive transcriptional regulator)